MPGKLLKTPESLVIAITGRCNLSCRYCFYADEMAVLDDLPTQQWLTLFEECREAGVMRITLSGGEVFARQGLWEIIDGIVRNKMRFSILTNGTLITEGTASRLDTYRRRIDFIQVSIDGSDSVTHDTIRGEGAFERMLQGIEALKKHRFPWTVRVTVNKLNVFNLESILGMLYGDLGLRQFGVNEAFPRGAGHCNHSSLEMTPRERRHAFRVMQEFDRAHPGVAGGAQAGPLIIANLIDKINGARQTGQFEVPYRTGYLTGCNIMWQKLSVLHDGTYVPCHQLPQIKLGQVGEDRLHDVWQHSPGLLELRRRSDIPLSTVAHCKDCAYQQYCTGGCPGVAYAMTGDVNTVNPRDCYRAYIGEDPSYVY